MDATRDEHPAPDPETTPSRLRTVFVVGAAVALAVFLLVEVWIGVRERGPEARVKELMLAGRAEIVQQPVSPMQANWRLETESGGALSLAALPRDTLIFLNFWATWCPPCRDELPSMLRLRMELGDQRMLMVAVSYDDDWDAIRQFFTRWIGVVPNRADQIVLARDPQPDGRALRESFGTTHIPDTYVILNGQVLARFVDERDWMTPAIIEYFKTIAPRRTTANGS